MYANVLGQSPAVDKAILSLQDKLRTELEFQRELFKLLGAIDAIVASAVA